MSKVKCSICKKNTGKHKPKDNWNLSGLLCSNCYDDKYSHDSESIINKPAYKKLKNIVRSKWWIIIGVTLVVVGILLR